MLTQKDADDQSVVVASGLALRWQREALTNGGFDGRRCRGNQVSELVGSTDDEGTEGTWGQLHKVNWNNTPGTLDAELLEEGGGDDGLAGGEGVWVEESTTNDGDNDDTEATTESLRKVTDSSTTGHGTEVCNDLSDGDGVGREVVLVGEHGWVEILGTVTHEVESSHQDDEVDEKLPVVLEGDFTFSDESAGDVLSCFADTLALDESVGLREAETVDDDQDWRAGTEPEKRSPSVRSGVDEATSEDGCEEVSECVSLLEHTRDDSSCGLWTVFKSGRRGVTVQTAHRHTVERTNSEELLVGLAETSSELEGDEKNVVDNERPLAAVAVRSDTKENSANGSEHENECDTPGDVGLADVEGLGEVGDGQRDGEEVESIPGPGDETTTEEEPLLKVEHGKELEWVCEALIAWLQGAESGCQVMTGAHVVAILLVSVGIGGIGLLVLELSGCVV